MKTKTPSLILLVLALTFATALPGHASRRLGTAIEGTIQTVNPQTKHATLLTKDGKTITFRWHETTVFLPETPLHKGSHVKVDYYESLLSESYVNRVEVIGAAKAKIVSTRRIGKFFVRRSRAGKFERPSFFTERRTVKFISC